MASFSLRYYKPGLPITIIGLATAGTAAISHFIVNRLGIAISSFGLATLLFTAVDIWLWKHWPCKLLYDLKDFQGRYTGSLEFQWMDDKGNVQTGKLTHTKIISQTGSGITIRSITYNEDGTESSSSESKVEHVKKAKDGSFTLIHTYLNQGDTSQRFPPHYGTEVLHYELAPSGTKRLKGEYYTNRLPYQTRGKVDVTLTN